MTDETRRIIEALKRYGCTAQLAADLACDPAVRESVLANLEAAA